MGDEVFEHDRHGFVQLLHDLRQYVAAGILLSAPGRWGPEDHGPERLERIHEVFLRMDELTAQPDPEQRQIWVVDLVQLVDECVSLARLAHGIPFNVEGPPRVEASCDPVLLRRAVVNVLDNATRATGASGHVRVIVSNRPGEALVEVSDEGEGFGRIPSGSGLGMSIVDQALRACQGSLEIISGPGPGTTVRMHIPSQRQMEDR